MHNVEMVTFPSLQSFSSGKVRIVPFLDVRGDEYADVGWLPSRQLESIDLSSSNNILNGT